MVVVLLAAAPISFAGVNMDVAHKLTLANPPLDVVSTPDGKFMFVLSEKGIISAFDQNGVLQNKIHVGEEVERIKMDPQGTRLFVTSRLGKSVQVIVLDFFVEINTADTPSMGPQNAPVVLAVFSDFQCPYCARLAPRLEQVLKQYPKSVRVVYKNFPLSSHKFAKQAAAAALAAERQGKFWEYHDELHKYYRNLSDKKFIEIAQQLGLDEAKFNKDRHDPAILERINLDHEEGEALEIRGIPALFMNGRRIQNRDLGKLQDIIDKQLKKAQ